MNVIDDARNTRRPGERLVERLWLMALAPSGRLPTLTLERVQAVKRLAADWEAVDEADASSTN